MTALSLRGAIDGKCRECIASDAGANWREHSTCCPITDCPLWRVRPLSKGAPDWLSSRDETALPPGWRSLSQAAALATVRNAPANDLQDGVTLSCGAKAGAGRARGQTGGEAATSAREAVTRKPFP